MAVDLAAPVVRSRALSVAVSARVVLGGIVVLSAVVRGFAALTHTTPYYFPDEYLYPALARGIASGHGPAVRGTLVHFPALLEPLLTAPFWLSHDPVVALRLTQALHGIAMSLAAVPVYLLARKLGLREWFALGSALVAVALPDLVYSSFTLSDPIAYPLVLAAVYAGVVALERPTGRAQLAFFAFAALATFARVQYAALPVVFAFAAILLEGRHVFSRYRLSVALWGVPALAVLAVGPGRLLGAYSGVTSVGIHPFSILRWSASDLMLLVYACGVVLVPGALVALLTPRTRAERAFSLLTLGLLVTLVAQAAFIASFDSHRVQERYLFPLLALAAPAFGLSLSRGRTALRAAWLIAGAFVLLSVRVPLSGFAAAHGKDDSPTLVAVLRLEQAVTTANGSFVVAVIAAVLVLAGALAVAKPKLGAPLALALAVAACGALGAAAQSYDARNAHNLRLHDMPADAQWVDHAHLGDVTLVETPGSVPAHALEALWWNSSLTSELLLGNGQRTDQFGGVAQVHIRPDGTLVTGGRPVTTPLLVQTTGTHVAFAAARVVATGPAWVLVKPSHAARLSLLADGLYADGWLTRSGAVTVWPDAHGVTRGTVSFTVSLPKSADAEPLTFAGRRVLVRPGASVRLSVPVDGRGPKTLHWSARLGGFTPDGRPVSVRATVPVLKRR